MPVTIHRARRAKETLAKSLAGTKELVGLGLTKRGDDYAVKVNLSSLPKKLKVPESIRGVPVCVEVTGRIRKREPS
jgi:hypothetical protein